MAIPIKLPRSRFDGSGVLVPYNWSGRPITRDRLGELPILWTRENITKRHALPTPKFVPSVPYGSANTLISRPRVLLMINDLIITSSSPPIVWSGVLIGMLGEFLESKRIHVYVVKDYLGLGVRSPCFNLCLAGLPLSSATTTSVTLCDGFPDTFNTGTVVDPSMWIGGTMYEVRIEWPDFGPMTNYFQFGSGNCVSMFSSIESELEQAREAEGRFERRGGVSVLSVGSPTGFRAVTARNIIGTILTGLGTYWSQDMIHNPTSITLFPAAERTAEKIVQFFGD